MKIGKVNITSGPNIQWYLFTVLFVVLGGWKGLFLWIAINVFFVAIAFATNKLLREHFFGKTEK